MKRKLVRSIAMRALLFGVLCALGGAASVALAQASTAKAGANIATPVQVQHVSVAVDSGGQTVVEVATSAKTVYRVFQLPDPDRLVIDFEGAVQAAGLKAQRSPSPLLSSVRVGQFRKDPAVVRVVADLVGAPSYDVQQVADGVRIVLKSTSSSAQPPAPHDTAPTQSAAAPAVPVPAVASALPVGNPSANASPKPEVMGEINEGAAADKAAKVISLLTAQTEAAPGQASAGAAASAPQNPQYTGEPISLNLKDVDLKDFFRLIHEISGLNIIVDPNVSGSVTLVLDNVPWDQALDIVLKNNQLGKVLEGNVLRIAKLSTLTAEQADAAKLVEAREGAQPLVTRFIPINYAKASVLAGLLKGWVGGGALSKRGNVLVDDRTNTLIVSDIASQIPIILPIVQKLDTKTKQIAIEARIEFVTRDFQRQLGNALNLYFINKSGSTQQSGNSMAGSSTTTSTKPPFTITTAQATGTGFGTYAISNVGARYIINDVLAAAESDNRAKAISKPMIVTQNNVPGNVIQGVEVPVQTTINGTISVQYVQASLQLTVTPQVVPDGNVFLNINVQNSTPGTPIAGLTAASAPPINQQTATTQVLVPDGGTVIFGGVTKNGTTDSEAYVPWLGKIPILGNLFKSSVKTENDVDLLFFVSPKVLPD